MFSQVSPLNGSNDDSNKKSSKREEMDAAFARIPALPTELQLEGGETPVQWTS